MILNHVQEKLVKELIEYARIKYPEVEIETIIEGPSIPNHAWVIVKGINWNDDDDRVMDFMEYSSEKETDILVEYGYPISLMPVLSV